MPQPRHNTRAFTIVELLVVMSIIVLLLALLLPSARRARYVAKFATCASQQRQIGVGVMIYTNDYMTQYPYRKVAFGSNPRHSKLAFNAKSGGPDDRPMLRRYLDINFMVCPFSPLEGVQSLDDSDHIDIHSSYEMYFGGPIVRGDAETWNMKISDHPLLPDLDTSGGYWQKQRYEHKILLADMDWAYFAIHQQQTSHPDFYTGLLQFEHRDHHLASQVTTHHTMTMWWNPVYERGAIDRNFLYKDGSVQPIYNLDMNDARLVRIPAMNNNWTSAQYHFLPRG
ncbi:MAG: hypothetical protein GC159_20365 [Phycisphaera sp.]|nr:hypothetical protein [Phycisphaera sp.]